jgi:hypothetical protein
LKRFVAEIDEEGDRPAVILPHLRAAVKAQVELYRTLRAIESEMGAYANDLDAFVAGLAHGLDEPVEADRLSINDAALANSILSRRSHSNPTPFS